MNKVYGFEGEAKSKYGDMTYKLFADVFTARKSNLSLLASDLIPPALIPSTRQSILPMTPQTIFYHQHPPLIIVTYLIEELETNAQSH
jgi:hypothetical protein